MQWTLMCIAVGIGMLMPLQPGINAELARHTGSPVFGMWVNMLVGLLLGTVAVGIVMAVRKQALPTGDMVMGAPWWSWLGGFLGLIVVTSTLMLAPRLGAALMIASLMTGQLIGSMVYDHFGVVGYPVLKVTPLRLVAVVLLVAGVILFRMGGAPSSTPPEPALLD